MNETILIKALWVFVGGFSGVFVSLIVLMYCVKALSLLPKFINRQDQQEKKGGAANV
ncbi:MAG: hypothetical protein N2Z74_09485 [Syntrophales bacterium]|nr:hypothetical protein [Syntrophales bacterium]